MYSIVHTIAGMGCRNGGPTRSVSGLCDALIDAGARVSLVTVGSDGDTQFKAISAEVRLVITQRYNDKWILRTGQFKRSLLGAVRETEPLLLHDHGIWLTTNHAVASVGRSLGIPRVVSPRGMLEPWALAYKHFRKRIAWHVYQRNDLESADAFHATSHSEALNIRRLGFHQPIAVIPNGIDLPVAGRFQRKAASSKQRQALFLSRLHPIKGLPDLINAWEMLRPIDWRLLIVGPDEGSHREKIQRMIDKKQLCDCVELVGEAEDKEKWRLLEQSHLLVLPSYSESFGLVVAEALAVGVPVITTRATPWSEIEDHGCGWWIDVGVEPLVKALSQALAMHQDALSEMGARGVELVAKRYSWTTIGAKMLDFYTWLTVGGNAPSCLYD